VIAITDLATTYTVVEAVLDFWRASMLASELEQRGLTVVSYPQSDSRMIPASQRLHDVIVDRRLVHPDDQRLNAHVHDAVAKQTRRGWRLDRPPGGAKVDGVIALAMAHDRSQQVPQKLQLLGWL